MAAKKKPPHRPTKYTQKIADTICERLGEGESLNAICKDMKEMSRVTVYAWLADDRHKDFLNKYSQARERQAESFVDECVDIADDNTQDTITVEGKDGKDYEKVNHDHINRSRLRVDTRIKIAEKMAPRKYALNRLEVSGSDDNPVVITTPEETLRKFAFMLRNKQEEEDKQGG